MNDASPLRWASARVSVMVRMLARGAWRNRPRVASLVV